MILSLLLAVLLALGVGYSSILLVWPRSSGAAAERCLRLSLALGFGFGITSLSYMLCRLLTEPSRPLLLAVDAGLCLGLAALGLWRRARTPVVEPLALGGPAAPWWLWSGFSGLLLLGAGAFLGMSMRAPHGAADAIAIWNLKARYLFLGGDVWQRAIQPVVAHPDYPLLVPASIARLWTYAGGHSVAPQALVGFLLTAGLVAIVVCALWCLRGGYAGLLGGVALLGTPELVKHGATQYSDTPLSAFMLAAIVLLLLAERAGGRRGLIALAGFSAGLAAWTKNEGVMFVLVLLLVQLLFALRRGGVREAIGRLGCLMAGMAAPLAMTFYLKTLTRANDLVAGQGAGSTLARLTDPERYLQIAQAFAGESLRSGHGLALVLIGFVAIAGGVATRARRPGLAAALAVLVVMFAGYFGVYVLTPHDLAWHLSTSMDRLFLQLWPSAILVALLFVNSDRPAAGAARDAVAVPQNA